MSKRWPTPPGAAGFRPGTTGTAVPAYDVVIRDDKGRDVPAGQPGYLHVNGASIAVGYLRRPEDARHVFRGDWLVIDDTYVRDEDGYLTCLGPESDLLRAGGIWVSPTEGESRLLEHPAVVEAAVVGRNDDDWLEKPVAVVVITAGATVSGPALIMWCRGSLAHFKAPRQAIFTDELPKTPTRKLQRFKVRSLLAATYYEEVFDA
ncbi:AMP-binding protein [Rhodococcus sp. NBC_00297]